MTDVDRSAIEFEIAALLACAHRNVVELIAASSVGNDTYLAMERCEGDLMRYLAAPRELSEASVAQMMRQVRRAQFISLSLNRAQARRKH